MSARRPIATISAFLCVLACALAVGVGSAGAATQFGSQGEGAGQFGGPSGVAFDQASGDVYVADGQNMRLISLKRRGVLCERGVGVC